MYRPSSNCCFLTQLWKEILQVLKKTFCINNWYKITYFLLSATSGHAEIFSDNLTYATDAVNKDSIENRIKNHISCQLLWYCFHTSSIQSNGMLFKNEWPFEAFRKDGSSQLGVGDDKNIISNAFLRYTIDYVDKSYIHIHMWFTAKCATKLEAHSNLEWVCML